MPQEKLFKFVFKKTKARTACLYEYTGTWQDLEMYFPGCVIVNKEEVFEEDFAF